LAGAEGGITLAVSGDEEQVTRAIEYAEAAKGAVLPRVRIRDCGSCHDSHCSLVGGEKSWTA